MKKNVLINEGKKEKCCKQSSHYRTKDRKD